MIGHLRFLIARFLPHLIRREVKELYAAVAIRDFAVSAVLIFEPIYLYQQGLGLRGVLFFYLGVYAIYFVLLPLGGKVARTRGFEHSMLFASPCTILYYLSLVLVPFNPLFLGVAMFAFALEKTFYWPGYHADFALYSVQEERGREISQLIIIDNLVYILGPLVGGLLVTFGGFRLLFPVAAGLIVLSNLPLLATRETVTPGTFSYAKAFRTLVDRSTWRQALTYVGFGEELIVLTVWPLFIFLVIRNFATMGVVVALSTFVSGFAVVTIGRLTDRRGKRPVLRFGAFVTMIAWFLRLFVRSSGHVFAVDTLSRLSKNIIMVPLTARLYERAFAGHVVRSVVFFEMWLTVGKILAAALVILATVFFPPGWSAAFIIAGLFTALYLADR